MGHPALPHQDRPPGASSDRPFGRPTRFGRSGKRRSAGRHCPAGARDDRRRLPRDMPGERRPEGYSPGTALPPGGLLAHRTGQNPARPAQRTGHPLRQGRRAGFGRHAASFHQPLDFALHGAKGDRRGADRRRPAAGPGGRFDLRVLGIPADRPAGRSERHTGRKIHRPPDGLASGVAEAPSIRGRYVLLSGRMAVV